MSPHKVEIKSENDVKALVEKLYAITHGEADIANDVVGRHEALRLCEKIGLQLEDPVDTAMKLRFYPSYTMAARIAIDLDIFKLLCENTKPMGVESIAQQTGASEDLIPRILRPLSALGLILETSENTWTASPATHAMNRPAAQAGHIHFWDQCTSVQAKLPEYLRKTKFQQPEDPRNGPLQFALSTDKSAWEYWHQDPAVAQNFNTFMTGSRHARPSWVDWWPVEEKILRGAGTGTNCNGDQDPILLVDVGGGRGHDVQAFQKKFGADCGVLAVEDLPPVIDDIQHLDGRIRRIKQDFFLPQPIHGARVYFFHFIMHDWSDDKCLEILLHTKKAMRKGYSKLILNEWIIPDVDCPAPLAGYDLAMMSMLSAQERTKAQWSRLMQRAGLTVIGFSTPGPGVEGIIEAEIE